MKQRHLVLGGLLLGLATLASAANRPAGYVTICTENKTCSVAANTNVAFGRADKFTYKVLSGSFVCSEATFGAGTKVAGGTNECSAPAGGSSSSASSSSRSSVPSSSSSSSSSRPSSSSSSSRSSSSSSVPSSSSSSATSSVSSSVSSGGNASGLVGFATLNRDGRNGTNGGAGGPTVVVSSFAALRDAVADNNPRIVQISGTITPDSGVQMISVGSNKTIVGIGSNATLTGVGFDVSGWTPAVRAANGGTECTPDKQNNFNHVNNVIIRNIFFNASSDDGVNVSCYSHHVWIDHNTFNRGHDGAIDIKRGADWATVSWNRFDGTVKTMLLGHDDSNGPQDRGHLHVTYHHNFFNGSDQRHPRVRFGQAHVYNNYALNTGDYMIGKGVECSIYADANFVDGADAVTDDYGGSDLTWTSDNLVVNVGPNDQAVANGKGFDPRTYYNWTPDPASSIATIVGQGSGVGKIVP